MSFLDRTENLNDPYARGRQDRVDGKSITKDCPYPNSKDRRKWQQGWYAQRDIERMQGERRR
jgi:ribosome modulation factor